MLVSSRFWLRPDATDLRQGLCLQMLRDDPAAVGLCWRQRFCLRLCLCLCLAGPQAKVGAIVCTNCDGLAFLTPAGSSDRDAVGTNGCGPNSESKGATVNIHYF